MVLSIVMIVVALAVSALAAFVPLTALPGDLQTGFVNASWVKVASIGFVGGALAFRLGPLLHQRYEPWWPSAKRFAWTFMSTFVLLCWSVGGLVWVNAFGVANARTHDMRITGFELIARSRGGSAIQHYKLAEIGSSWTADLEPNYEEDGFAKEGNCVRITVREGRLGLDWISDADPIPCPPSASVRPTSS